ncbi:MAG: hypothetical protein LLG06_11335, partial [Desulfobacteraceae bacterium]|nr:hypothetical protein [Desulfobacteraceae bacterium]
QLQRRADLQAQIEKTTTDMGREKGAAEAEIEGLKAKYREVAAEIKKVEAVLAEKEQIEGAAARAQELEAAITVLQEAVDKAERDRERAQEEVHRIEKEIESLKQIRKDLEDDKDLRELVAKGVELQGKANEQAAAIKALSNDPETARLTAELATLKSRAAERDLYDPACTSTICAAIAEALKAKEKVPAAEEALKARTEEVTRLKAAAQAIIDAHAPEIENFRQAMRYREKWIAAEKTRLAGEIGPLGHSLQNHQQVVQGNTDIATLKRREIVTIRSAIATKKALATRLPDLRVAESRKQELNKQQAENVAAGSEKNKALNETIARFNETLAGLNETIRQIDATINYDAEAGLKDLMAEIKEIETMNLPNSDNLIERAKSRLAALKGDLDRITAAGKELTSVRVERDALASRVSHWRYLQNACGKNGLQALEIDGAAPLISSRANELLMRGYGPQYTVRIDTQDEEGREDLDIKVLSEWGTDSLKMKSGGERVWLLHAVRLAMALLNKEKSGRAWDMAFFDEVTGALDSKGAASSFMSMYQPFMALGGIKQAFFVTHQDECLSYADHILRFEPGKNPAWQ